MSTKKTPSASAALFVTVEPQVGLTSWTPDSGP